MKPEDKKKFIAGKVMAKLTETLIETRIAISKTVDESMEQLLCAGFTEDEAAALLHTIVDLEFAREV